MTKRTNIAPLPPAAALSLSGEQELAAVGDRPRGNMTGTVRRSIPAVPTDQFLRLLTCLGLCYWALKMVPFAGGAAIVVVTLLVALVLVVPILLVRPGSRYSGKLDFLLLMAAMLACCFWVRAATGSNPGYGTDEVTLGQASAQVLLSGHNPYTSDLSWAAQRYGLPPQWVTHTLDNRNVSTATYPALSFLVYAPALLLGIDAQAAIYVDTVFWLAGMLALWLVLPWRFRPAATVFLTFMSGSSFTTDLVGGVTDVIYVPFLIAALWRWDRFGDPVERSIARWMGPAALGLACTVKQGPWLLAPFLLIAVCVESHRHGRSVIRTGVAYAALAAGSFLLPNLPFLILAPAAWLHGTLLPFVEPLVPLGQGLIGFSIYLGLGGGNLALYSLAGALVASGLMLALIWKYSALKRVFPIFPATVLFFATRSFPNYFLFPVFGLLIGAVTTRTCCAESPSGRRSIFDEAVRVGTVLCLTGACATVMLALLTPSPLKLRITGAGFGGEPTSLDKLIVTATNRGDRPINPQFTVFGGGNIAGFWLVEDGPTHLAPGQSAQYSLAAPNLGSMPRSDQGVVVYAYGTRPSTISMSAPGWTSGTHVELTPRTVLDPVPRGREIMLTASLHDRFGPASHEAGVRVYLDQVVYSSLGALETGHTSIDGVTAAEGPAVANTDDRGEAHFRIGASAAEPREVFYQAWTDEGSHRAYSNRVGIQFEP